MKIMNNSEYKNVIVTGCNGLIGRKLCDSLKDKKINIFGIDFEDKNTDISKFYEFYCCDLTFEKSVNSIVENIYEKVDNIDCLIHLAGIDYKVQEKNKKLNFNLDHNSISSPEIVMKSLSANVSMVYNIIYSLLPKFLNQDNSRIILIGSVYGSYSPNPKLYKSENSKYFYQKPIEYSLSKSIFPTLTKYLCAHYANQGLVINNVEPHAIIDSPDKIFLSNFKELSPMERICKSSEIADLITYLVLSKCFYLNGETIRVDGGWTAV
tara:strand:+ start:62 stop:859 length:798 start_codon:yes stop_codon:yes gene_type:complete